MLTTPLYFKLQLIPSHLLNIHGAIETNAFDNPNGANGRLTSKGFLIGDAYTIGKGSKAGINDDRNMCLWQERGLNMHFGVSDELAATIDCLLYTSDAADE